MVTNKHGLKNVCLRPYGHRIIILSTSWNFQIRKLNEFISLLGSGKRSKGLVCGEEEHEKALSYEREG